MNSSTDSHDDVGHVGPVDTNYPHLYDINPSAPPMDSNRKSRKKSKSNNTYHDLSLAKRIKKALDGYEIPEQMLEDIHALQNYDIIALCDDSSSMQTLTDSRDNHGQLMSRFQELQENMKTVVKIGSRLDEDGMDIYFLNSDKKYTNVTDPTNVKNIFNFEPAGTTPLTQRLKEIMRIKTTNPKLIIICTDGEPTNRDGRVTSQTKDEFEALLRERDVHNNKICIHLCTDNDRVVEYADHIDQTVPNICVIDDFNTETQKVREYQGSGFTYDHGVHILRMLLGPVIPIYDLLTEERLYYDKDGVMLDPQEAKKLKFVYDHSGNRLMCDRGGKILENIDQCKDFYDMQGNKISKYDQAHPRYNGPKEDDRRKCVII